MTEPQTIEEISAQINDSLAEEEAEIVALLPQIQLQREIRNIANATDKKLTERVKRFLEQSGKPELYDGEHEIRAFLQERKKPGQADGLLDLKTMAERHPEMLVELAKMGALSADVGMVKKQQDQSIAAHDAMQRYLMPGGITVSLQIEGPKS